MTGVTAIMAGMGGGGGGVLYTLVGAEYTDFSVSPVDARTSITVDSDGTLTVNTWNAGILEYYDWITPTNGASTHYVRLAPTSGAFEDDSPINTWLSLTSTQSWSVYQPTFGTNSATGTLAIATDSGGTNIVASASITLIAQVDI